MAGKWLAALCRIKCMQCSARRNFAVSDSQSVRISRAVSPSSRRHCEEPMGPREVARLDDRLSDEAIQP
jgi:hypothetical protein